MDLDKRVGDYAAAIVHDADLLLADGANLNVEQQHFVDAIKRTAGYILELYKEYISGSPELDIYTYVSYLLAPSSNIAGYCELLGRADEYGSLNEAQLQRLEQIKTSQRLMREVIDTFRKTEADRRWNSGT